MITMVKFAVFAKKEVMLRSQYIKREKVVPYTDLKTDDKPDYFTYWLERETEAAGKFRTASSYAFGIGRSDPMMRSCVKRSRPLPENGGGLAR